mmetsp:Transcript_22141/g.68920  ORF Transcript_22141/g.68920 Transcript_22141/m.68920 type:complete len:154 (-) Transcript_22141:85-546(-)
MSHGKVVELLEFYKPHKEHKVKINAEFAGTHYETSAKYPSFFDECRKGRVPGDVGWNVENNEHAFAARQGGAHISAISDKRFCRADGFAMKGVDSEVKHNFMKLPGRNTGDPYFKTMVGGGGGGSYGGRTPSVGARTPSRTPSVASSHATPRG